MIVDQRTQNINIPLKFGIDGSCVRRQLVEIVEIVIITYLDPSGNAVMLGNWIKIRRWHNDRGRRSLGRCKIHNLGVKWRN